jgi:hypothetical protein
LPATNLGLPMARPEHGLYWDPKANNGQGARISTHSMLKTFRRCPKQAEFKYVHRLKPKRLGSPLKRGTWVHALLEAHSKGQDWRKVHDHYTKLFNEMFDEEKDYYGDMPREIMTIFKSYLWHYKNDPWEYLDAEFQLEATLPDGTVYRGKVDALIRNQFGLWLVDHKTHKTLPRLDFRLLDSQSALYLWAAQENGLKVNGFIWNYIRWKAPSTPKLLVKGDRISDSPCDTDYPTFVRALKKYKNENPGFVIRDKDRQKAAFLKSQQYEFGKLQTSDFFRRDVLEKSPDMIERVLQGNYTTSLRMHDYDFDNPDQVERVVERSCEFSCSYTDICTTELVTGDASRLMKQNYIQGDPNDYYNDRAGDYDKEER